MQKYNKIFNNLAKLLELGLISSKDIRKEIESFVQFRVQSIINKFNLPSREEVDVIKKRLEKIENKYLKKKRKKLKKK